MLNAISFRASNKIEKIVMRGVRKPSLGINGYMSVHVGLFE